MEPEAAASTRSEAAPSLGQEGIGSRALSAREAPSPTTQPATGGHARCTDPGARPWPHGPSCPTASTATRGNRRSGGRGRCASSWLGTSRLTRTPPAGSPSSRGGLWPLLTHARVSVTLSEPRHTDDSAPNARRLPATPQTAPSQPAKADQRHSALRVPSFIPELHKSQHGTVVPSALRS